MTYSFKLPDIGEGVHEGEILHWFVKQGDQVEERQVIVEVMTDKASVEITSPVSGWVSAVHYPEGSVVKTGEVFIEFSKEKPAGQTDKMEPENISLPAAIPKPVQLAQEAKPQKKAVDIFSPPEDLGGMYSLDDEEQPFVSGEIRALPKTRKLARELGIDLSKIKGSGNNGRITDEDIISASQRKTRPAQAPAITVQEQQKPDRIFNPAFDPGLKTVTSEGIRKPLTGLRKKIAENMEASHHFIPKAVHFDELDLTDLVALRNRLKGQAAKKGTKLTYLPFFAKAAAIALQEFPDINACFDEKDRSIVEMSRINLGIAVDTDKGLIVPVVKDADKKTIVQLAEEISILAEQARQGRINAEDLKDASFTITNIGSIGGLMSVPVVYHPQAAIMATHSIKQRPVVMDGGIAVRDIMNISIAFDHRITDGARIARFGNRIKEMLETPFMLAFL
ncbi:MAG: 2-oxo acid dehydrogenase subunit E2 [Firmicutes bacterium]|nr:2-oxo acid dehydrogenase subunit E2 [Bacillota bacterium]